MSRLLFLLAVPLCAAPLAAAAQEADEPPLAPPEGEPGEGAADAAAERARAHFSRGQTAYRQGDYDGAVEAWNAAYEIDPRPRIQFNLSQAYERLGRLADAVEALDRYLAEAGADDEFEADAHARRSALRERLSRTGIRIGGSPPDGAVIEVDGRDWGRTPRPDAIGVEPGPHRVVVRVRGYRDFNATLVVPAGEAVEVDVQMEEAAEVSGDTSVWPFIFMGAGAAFGVIGGLFGLIALSAAEDAPSSEGSQANAARAAAGVADVAFLVAILAAGTGVAWLLLDGDDEDGDEGAASARAFPWLTPHGAGAGAVATF